MQLLGAIFNSLLVLSVLSAVWAQNDEQTTLCPLGSVELNNDGACLDIATELTIEAFLGAFPNATFDPRSDETDTAIAAERLVNLRRLATLVSEHSNNPSAATDDSTNKPYQLALNALSAETLEERGRRNGFRGESEDDAATSEGIPTFRAGSTSYLYPNEVDWVEKGMVTVMKNQLYCGSCWSIAAIGAIESKYLIDMAKNDQEPAESSSNSTGSSFSFQQLISCDKDNSGCNGGFVSEALQYSNDNSFGGVTTWLDYPYTDRDGTTTETCDVTGKELAYRPPKARKVVERRDKLSFQERLQKMKQGLAEQPVAIAMAASCDLFMAYKGGVLTDDGGCACSKPNCLDHAVLMVGYNDNHDPPYFLVKNSWGQLYGEDGYFRVAQTAKGDYGLFGILSEGYFPSENTDFDEATAPLTLGQVIMIAIACALVLSLVLFGMEKWWRSRRSNTNGEEEEEGAGKELDVEF